MLPAFGLFLFSCNYDLTLFRNSNQCLAPRELLPLTEMSQWCFSPVVLQDTSRFYSFSSVLCLLQDKKVSQLHLLLLGVGLRKIDINKLGNVQCRWHKLVHGSNFLLLPWGFPPVRVLVPLSVLKTSLSSLFASFTTAI